MKKISKSLAKRFKKMSNGISYFPSGTRHNRQCQIKSRKKRNRMLKSMSPSFLSKYNQLLS